MASSTICTRIVALLNRLYRGEDGGLRRGTLSWNRAGCLRRLVVVLGELSLTYDIRPAAGERGSGNASGRCPSRASTELRATLERGVAFHVSDLDRLE